MAELGTVERAYADGYAAAQAEIAKLQFMAEAKDEANKVYAERNAELASVNARLRAALGEIGAMCNRGESHTWIARIASKALANEQEQR